MIIINEKLNLRYKYSNYQIFKIKNFILKVKNIIKIIFFNNKVYLVILKYKFINKLIQNTIKFIK